MRFVSLEINTILCVKSAFCVIEANPVRFVVVPVNVNVAVVVAELPTQAGIVIVVVSPR